MEKLKHTILPNTNNSLKVATVSYFSLKKDGESWVINEFEVMSVPIVGWLIRYDPDELDYADHTFLAEPVTLGDYRASSQMDMSNDVIIDEGTQNWYATGAAGHGVVSLTEHLKDALEHSEAFDNAKK